MLEFNTKYNLSSEELFLLYTLYIKHEQISPEIYGLMDKYYSSNKNKGFAYVDMIKGLQERGFLVILKESEDSNSIQLKNLRISEEFIDILFIDPEEIWIKFYERYPDTGYMNGQYFTANMVDPKNDKQTFIKKILKNVNKAEAQQLLYVMEDMFDWNPFTKKPDRYARVGISKFIHNWDEILKQWKEDSENTGSTYKSL